MTITRFGVCVATDRTTPPTDDAAFTWASISGAAPKDFPTNDPDGDAIGRSDGSSHFTARGRFSVKYAGIALQDGVNFFSLFSTARNTTNSLVWVAYYNMRLDQWDVVLTTMLKPVGKIDGVAYRDFVLSFDGLGTDSALDFYLGQANPGSPSIGTYFGRGTFGSGKFGE